MDKLHNESYWKEKENVGLKSSIIELLDTCKHLPWAPDCLGQVSHIRASICSTPWQMSCPNWALPSVHVHHTCSSAFLHYIHKKNLKVFRPFCTFKSQNYKIPWNLAQVWQISCRYWLWNFNLTGSVFPSPEMKIWQEASQLGIARERYRMVSWASRPRPWPRSALVRHGSDHANIFGRKNTKLSKKFIYSVNYPVTIPFSSTQVCK